MINQKRVTGIILVAGNSTRYGTGTNKNLEQINGKTVLEYSLKAFLENEYIDDILVAVKKEEVEKIKEIVEKENRKTEEKNIKIIIGGATRTESVYNCITSTDSDIVIIQDGARPAIKQRYINECIETMQELKGATIGVKSKDTIKITDENNIVTSTTKRSNTWIIQTPQCFDRQTLLAMHEKYKQEEVTDDCMLLEKGQFPVKIIEGDYTNIKITTYEDINIIKQWIN